MMKEDSTQTGGIIRWGLKTWEGDMAPCLCSMSAHMGSKGSAIPQILLPCSAAVFSFKYSENYVTINSILTAAERVDAFEFMCDSILWRDIDWRKIKKKEKEKLVWSPALLCLTSCQTKEKTLSPPADKIWIALPHLITCYYDYLRHLAWKLRGDLEHCVSYNSIESEQITYNKKKAYVVWRGEIDPYEHCFFWHLDLEGDVIVQCFPNEWQWIFFYVLCPSPQNLWVQSFLSSLRVNPIWPSIIFANSVSCGLRRQCGSRHLFYKLKHSTPLSILPLHTDWICLELY